MTAGSVYALRPAVLRVEKASNTSDLRNEQRRAGDGNAGASHAARARKPSHYDTSAHEPLWNGPPLNAAFVAQLIGQVLVDEQGAPASAQSAYGHRVAGPRSLVFDGVA